MRKEILSVGIIMQVLHLVGLTIFLVEWNIDTITQVIAISIYALFNITSLIFIFVGAFSRK